MSERPTEDNIQTQIISRSFIDYSYPTDWKNILHKAGIIISGLFLVFLIILLKSKTTADFFLDPSLFSYAIFITTFEFSRIISSMLYGISYKSLMRTASKSISSLDYEPKIAFIIPCKNEEKDIAESIQKCYEADYPREKLEVIVINDGSTDNTLNILKSLKKNYPSLKIIDWPNQGKRWAMAAGFRISNAEIIIQLDSDSYIEPASFRDLINPFQNPRVAAVCANGEPKNADKNIITRMQAAYYFMSFHILKAAESTFNTVFCCSGCCSAYRKSAVMPVLYHWLSESFWGRPVTWGDDRALTSWLLKDGWKTVYCRKARARTIVPDSFRKLLKQQLRWKKSWIINSIFTSRFIFKKQPFVAFFYYFPLIMVSFLTPIMTFRALVYDPFIRGITPLSHVLGVVLVTTVMIIYYRYLDKQNKYWPYLFLWSMLNLFILSFMIVIAAIRIQDRGWGTR